MEELSFDAAALVSWFHREGRIYPWSLTSDPYAIWISEVMLQQTVVTAVLSHYERWLHRWPTIADLAKAKEDDVLRAWEGLGYASRGKNLWKAANELFRRGAATLPQSYDELRALPGVGDYTACALLSFAWNQPYLTLDANLKRVFQRLTAQSEWTASLETSAKRAMDERFRTHESRNVNLALMQLGQLVCTPKTPKCETCPISAACRARLEGVQASIPLKAKSVKSELRTIVGVWTRKTPAGTEFFLAKPQSGRFSNLWLFPPATATPQGESFEPLSSRVHTYTKFKDALSPFVGVWNREQDPAVPQGWIGRWVDSASVGDLAMASVYRKIWVEAKEIARVKLDRPSVRSSGS